jgi:hypothetical protein
MSTMQNDKKNLQFRSVKPDPGSEKSLKDQFRVPLRDATVESLVRKTNDMELGLKIQQAWLQHNTNVSENQQRMEHLAMWDEHLEEYDMAYDGESNLHLPLPMIVLKTFHARMYQALFAVDPWFNVRAMQQAYVQDVEMVYGLMNWTLKEWANYGNGVEAVVDRWLWNWCAYGSGVLKVRWDTKFTRYMDVVDTYARGPSTWEIIINPERGTIEEVEKPSVIRSQIETPVTEKIFDGPVVEFVPKEDIAIIGGSDVQQCDMVIHRAWLTASQLQSEALRGVFSQEVVDDMIEGGPHSESGKVGQNRKMDRETADGIKTLDVAEDLDRYEILECYCEVDVNNDGLNESIIVWVDNFSGKVLRATYTHRVLQGGKRPFANIEFIPREGHAYAMGLLELIHPISVEMDMIHNIKVDIGIMAAQPIGFYRAATGMDPVKLRIKPGDLIPVDEPSSHVFFPNLGDRSGFFKDEEALLMQHVERLTSINDINTATLGRQGAARTATGVSALLNENSANLDIFIRRMQRGWKQILRVMWQMLQQRIPDGTEFRATGQDGREYFQRIKNKMQLRLPVDFFIEANSAQSNAQMERDMKMQVLAQAMNPMLVQMGIVDANGIYEAEVQFMRALGFKEYGRVFKRPPIAPMQLTAEEELARLVNGKRTPVTPESDHENFIRIAEQLVKSPDAPSMYGGGVLNAVQSQIQQHKAMVEALQAQAKQIAQANQQQFNGMGPGGGAAPGQAPFMNAYNDFQAARSQLQNGAADQMGGPIPGQQAKR